MTLPAVVDNDDGFADIADTASRLVGEIVKFIKGRYVIGREEGELNGATLIAYGVWRCWQKWRDRKVIDSIFPEPDRPLPRSAEDIDDPDAKPKEWQLTHFLYMRDPGDGADYTFVTSSSGGRRAIEALSRQIRNTRTRRPGALPLIRLDTGTNRHQEHGVIPKPIFPVAGGWVTQDGRPYDEEKNKVTTPSELEDDIPF